MELVIKLSKEDYEIMKHNVEIHNPLCPLNQENMVNIIANGMPIPEGHGRLIDADTYRKEMLDSREFDFFKRLDMQPTIIEADAGSEEV